LTPWPAGVAQALQRQAPRPVPAQEEAGYPPAFLDSLRRLTWTAPDGRLSAHLRREPAGASLVGKFFLAANEPARVVAGQPVWLGQVFSVVEADGRAVFPLDQVRRSQAPLSLEVGPGRVPWLTEPSREPGR